MIVETIACLQLLGREPLIMPGAVVRSPTPPLWVLVPSDSVSISHGRSPPSVCVWIDEREGNCAAFPIKALYKCECIYHLEFPDAQSKVSADVVSPSSLWRNSADRAVRRRDLNPIQGRRDSLKHWLRAWPYRPTSGVQPPSDLVCLNRRNSLQPGERLLKQHIIAQSFGMKNVITPKQCNVWLSVLLAV